MTMIQAKNLSDYFIDITAEICPFTFVKTKLMLEKMGAGQTLAVHLKGQEPLRNVPAAVADEGHTIISLEPLSSSEVSAGSAADADGVYRLLVRKGGAG